MAKILAKTHSSNQAKLIKLRQELDFYRGELDALDEKYNLKLEKKLDAFVVKANKMLKKAAFDACDKEEYAEAVLLDKLQKYDIKAYMEQRRINHGASKKIFAAIRKGEDISPILGERQRQMAEQNVKRARFIASLEEKKDAFIQKHSASDSLEFDKLKAGLEAEYFEREKTLKAEFDQKCEAEKANLEAKISKLEIGIADLKARTASNIALPDDILLRVRGLKMYFGGLKAVDDLDFDVKKGEIFGLIGPNGAGKTTVFNCITRFYDATGGDMYFENKYGEVVDLRNFKVHDIILQGIGRTFQNIELVKEISVIENLLVASTRSYKTGFVGHLFAAPSLKKEEKMLRAKAMKILEFMGLESYAQWYAMGLPYGILKKVEIARALMADAKLIIMDEPAAGLNDSETAELTETIRKIRDEFGVTILLVEHDMSLVMNVCDTVCAISFGQMLGIGTTEEIQNNKAVQEAYLGVAEED